MYKQLLYLYTILYHSEIDRRDICDDSKHYIIIILYTILNLDILIYE